MKDYKSFEDFSDKKLRTLRNNINNRLEAFKKGDGKNLPPSHMLHGMDEAEIKTLLVRVQKEMKERAQF